MTEQEILDNYAKAFEGLKFRLLNDYASRIDAKHTYATLAAGFEPDMLEPYKEYTGSPSRRPVNISVAMAPFLYDLYLAGSDSLDLVKITQEHAEELQTVWTKSPEAPRIMTANMVALLQAMAEKEQRSAIEVYEKLDDAFSSKPRGSRRTILSKEYLDAFHLAGRYVGAEKRPIKTLQDICDLIYTKPSYSSKEEKVKALKVCAKRYLSNPRTKEEYLVVLADCKQDIRRLIDGKISQGCFRSIKDISPEMAEQLKIEGFVGKWVREEEYVVEKHFWYTDRYYRPAKIPVPESRFDGERIEEIKSDIEFADVFAKPFSRWRDKLMALSLEPSQDEVQDFLEATKRFADSEPDEVASQTIRLCGKVISAFAQKDFQQVSDLDDEMVERVHTHRVWTTGSYHNCTDVDHHEDIYDEHDKFYESRFGYCAYLHTRDYEKAMKALEDEPRIREEQLQAQREAERQAREKAEQAEREADAKRAEEQRRQAALDKIGAFSENGDIDKDFEPISLSEK